MQHASARFCTLARDCPPRQVLTTGFWPTYKSDELNLPKEMLQCITTFKAFFDVRHSHRQLRWVHSLGSATVLGFTVGVSIFGSAYMLVHDRVVHELQATQVQVKKLQARSRS